MQSGARHPSGNTRKGGRWTSRTSILEDNEEDGRLTGEVKFILYKGNHYHLTVFTDWDEDIFVDTNDVWDDGDRVGIRIAPENIRITNH